MISLLWLQGRGRLRLLHYAADDDTGRRSGRSVHSRRVDGPTQNDRRRLLHRWLLLLGLEIHHLHWNKHCSWLRRWGRGSSEEEIRHRIDCGGDVVRCSQDVLSCSHTCCGGGGRRRCHRLWRGGCRVRVQVHSDGLSTQVILSLLEVVGKPGAAKAEAEDIVA